MMDPEQPADSTIRVASSIEAVKMVYDGEDWAIFGSIRSEASHIVLRVAQFRMYNRYGRFGIGKFRDAARRLGNPLVIEQKCLPDDTDYSRQLNVILDARPAFRVYFIRLRGPDSGFTVRILLVETTRGKTIYEGIGSWLQCEYWIIQLSGWLIPRGELAAVRKCLENKRMGVIEEIRASARDVISAGLSRVDS